MKHRDTETQRSDEEEINRLTFALIGAAMEVHQLLGPGFLESVYQSALEVELDLRGMRYDRQLVVPIEYKGRVLGAHVIDLVVEGQLVVELKAVEQLIRVHYSQVHSYLKATACDLGLLINFNVPVLKDGVRRVVLKGADVDRTLNL